MQKITRADMNEMGKEELVERLWNAHLAIDMMRRDASRTKGYSAVLGVLEAYDVVVEGFEREFS